MFVNDAQVLTVTGKVVTNAQIHIAQGIIEAYCGRTEDEVISPDDFAMVAKAVAYQCAYMINDSDKVFEQVAIVQQAQMDGSVTMDKDMVAPWIAPLAVLTLRNVSWKRSRSVKTGPVFAKASSRGSWYTE